MRESTVVTTTTTTIPAIHGWVEDGALRSGSGHPGYGEGRCPQWEAMALSAGWTAEQWPTVSRLMYAESLCNPNALNPRGHGELGHAAGLMQVMDLLWASECDIWPSEMYDPYSNLKCALYVFSLQGWEAWTTF